MTIPSCIILRGNQPFEPDWKDVVLDKGKNAGKKLRKCTFYPAKEDRIILLSDGVAQSGMGSNAWPLGWERDNVSAVYCSLVSRGTFHLSTTLAGKIVTMAYKYDSYEAKDDISCAILYFREPRHLLICSRAAL